MRSINSWKPVKWYLDNLKSWKNLVVAALWGLILVFAKTYADLVFHWIGLFFTYVGDAVTFLAYLPINLVGWFTSLFGFTNIPQNILILVFVIGFSILVQPLMKFIFQKGDVVQDWLYQKIGWKK